MTIHYPELSHDSSGCKRRLTAKYDIHRIVVGVSRSGLLKVKLKVYNVIVVPSLLLYLYMHRKQTWTMQRDDLRRVTALVIEVYSEDRVGAED